MGSVKNNKTPGLRAVGYSRVSSEEQIEGYSISAQERAYRHYVETQGYISVGEYKDEGKSARTDNIRKRPQFAQMLEDAQAGLFDVIVVHKMDRFSRSLRVAVQVFELLGKCNIGLVSVSEPNLDYSTPQGKLFMHMIWALSQFYSDNLSQETKKGKTERKQQGLYNGHLPFGIMKSNDGLPVPDTRDLGLGENKTNYAALIHAFKKAAEGLSTRLIAEELNSLGYRTQSNRGNNLFTKDTVWAILRNRFYLGELPDGEYTPGKSRRGSYTKGLKGRHEALVPKELWEAAQRAHEVGLSHPGRPATSIKARTYSLSGLLTCSYCGGKIHMHPWADGKARIYCYRRGQGVAQDCKQKAVPLSEFENQVEQYLSSISLPDNYKEVILEAYKKENDEGPGFEKQRSELENRLKRLQTIFTWGDIPEEEYKAIRDQIRGELAALPPASSSKASEVERLANYLQSVGQAWKDAGPEQRNRLAKTLFESIRIEDSTIKGVTPQLEFTPLLVLDHFKKRQGSFRKSGSDGIRTRGLFLDREAC